MFFNKEKNDPVLQEMQATRERFFVFIGKLEEKLIEFAEASIPELTELNKTDADEYKRAYHRMKAAVLGQLNNIMEKARSVQEEKITYFSYDPGNHDLSSAYYDFRSECYGKVEKLDELLGMYRQKIEDTFSEDLEGKYKEILQEYDSIKDTFKCNQCGSPVFIDKLYFTTTYLICPSCGTKNTFEPGSKAKSLEHLGRSLAEQRTAHLLKEHDEIPGITHDLYLKKHNIQLSLIHENDKRIIEQKTREMNDLEKQMAALKSKQPASYQTYLRAMFDEWNKINPAMAGEHEKFYNRLLNDYNKIN